MQPLQYGYICVNVRDKGKAVVESNYDNNELRGNIYSYYNLAQGKQEGYRCTEGNCHFVECKQ